jgi:hypothetical protein
MKKHNVGIIGYSWAAGAHLEAINNTSYALVIALCSSRKLDSAEINANHGGTIKFYTDLAQMITDPNLHAVSICSYPGDVSDHSYQVQFEPSYEAIDEGRGMPLTSLADALKTHELVIAADKSANHNTTKK